MGSVYLQLQREGWSGGGGGGGGGGAKGWMQKRQRVRSKYLSRKIDRIS